MLCKNTVNLWFVWLFTHSIFYCRWNPHDWTLLKDLVIEVWHKQIASWHSFSITSLFHTWSWLVGWVGGSFRSFFGKDRMKERRKERQHFPLKPLTSSPVVAWGTLFPGNEPYRLSKYTIFGYNVVSKLWVQCWRHSSSSVSHSRIQRSWTTKAYLIYLFHPKDNRRTSPRSVLSFVVPILKENEWTSLWNWAKSWSRKKSFAPSYHALTPEGTFVILLYVKSCALQEAQESMKQNIKRMQCPRGMIPSNKRISIWLSFHARLPRGLNRRKRILLCLKSIWSMGHLFGNPSQQVEHVRWKSDLLYLRVFIRNDHAWWIKRWQANAERGTRKDKEPSLSTISMVQIKRKATILRVCLAWVWTMWRMIRQL